MIVPAHYEYAGFTYYIEDLGHGLRATPTSGQHPAAAKEKHRQAAVECFVQDHGSGGC